MKKTALLFVCLFAATSLFAQNNPSQKYVNWFVSAGSGIQFFQTKYSSEPLLIDHITANYELSVGKWFTPVWGARLNFDGARVIGIANDINSPFYESMAWDNKDLNEIDVRYFASYVDLMFNPLAANCPNSYRFYEFIPYAGIGYVHGWNVEAKKDYQYAGYKFEKYSTNTLSGHFGIINRFRLSRALDFNVNLNSKWFSKKFDLQKSSVALGVTGGFTVKF